MGAHPRFRERWVAVRREEGHRRLRVLIVVGSVVAVIAAAGVTAYSPLLAVRHVRILGTAHVSSTTVLAVSDLGHHPPMLEVHAGAVVARLEHLPWVASAQVSRQWPTTVRIVVHERRPVASIPAGPAGTVEVDATGRVLTAPGASPATPRLVGPWPPEPPGTWLGGGPAGGLGGRPGPAGGLGGRPLGAGQAAAGPLRSELAVAAALVPAVAHQVSTISVDRAGDGHLVLIPGSIGVTLGRVSLSPSGSAVLGTQVTALATLLAGADLRGVAQIDLTVPGRPALTPGSGRATVSTASRG